MNQTTITDISAVGIPVSDQDKAVEFFTGTLGFEKRLDATQRELPLGYRGRARRIHFGGAHRQP